MFYGLALCASLFTLFTKARLLMYKLRKRSSVTISPFFSDVEERLDIHRQRMTKALLYLLVSSCEVQRRRPQPVPIGSAYECAVTHRFTGHSLLGADDALHPRHGQRALSDGPAVLRHEPRLPRVRFSHHNLCESSELAMNGGPSAEPA